MKEKNQLQLGNRLHDFSFFLSVCLSLLFFLAFFTQIYNCKKKKKNSSYHHNSQAWWSMTGSTDDARRWKGLDWYRL
jgi:hypothetical protein